MVIANPDRIYII